MDWYGVRPMVEVEGKMVGKSGSNLGMRAHPFGRVLGAGLLGSSWISICRPNGGLEKMEKMMEEEIEDDRYLDLEICIPWLLTNTFRRKEEEL